MATYSRPGVFIEETLQPLADPAANTNDAVAAFVGASSSGGPLGPTLLTSVSQYQALFGNLKDNRSDDLGFAVYSFFKNGGSRALVVRAVNEDATAASVSTGEDNGGLTFTAKAPGTWASDGDSKSRILISTVARAGDRFDLRVSLGSGASALAVETFNDLSLDPNDSRSVTAVVNSPVVGSKYILVEWDSSTTSSVPTITDLALVGGYDGVGSPDLVAAVASLEDVDASIILNLPGVSDPDVLSDVITWAGEQGNVFVVVDPDKPATGQTGSDVEADAIALAQALPGSSYAAVYSPYLYLSDPTTSGALRLTAPGGAVVGQYIKSDTTRGVAKAPAGISTTLDGVLGVSNRFSNTSLDNLNGNSVNVIRPIPGAGTCIMGARTLNAGFPDRYINIRRTLISLKRELVRLSRFAIFEENNEDTWEAIHAVLTTYLNTQFQNGTLSGNVIEEAFFVKCDEDNNTPQSVAAGIVNVDVGVALSGPSEFIVIRIGQFDGGVTVTDELTNTDI